MYKSVHLALPVRSLERSVTFFDIFFRASVITFDDVKRCCTIAYDRFEISLFEQKDFTAYKRSDIGPFHIGHEVHSRSKVDKVYELAKANNIEVVCSPFERDDGDYAIFIRDEQGIIFEFFHGGHTIARSAYILSKGGE